MPGFFINGKRFFLTYSQVDESITHDIVYACLGWKRNYKRCIVARELHQDGGLHYHVAVEFTERIQSRRSDFFDVGAWHPNVQNCKSWAACVRYTQKDGDVRYYDCTAEDALELGEETADTGTELFALCETSAGLRDWYAVAISKEVSYSWANAIWNVVRGPRPPTISERLDGGVIGDFALQCARLDDSPRCTVVIGPSGIGKTTWVLRHAPMPYLLVTDPDDLGFFDGHVHKSIVFDEIRTTGDTNGKGRWPLTAVIKLLTYDTPVSVRIRYKVAHIPAGIPKLFTATDYMPFDRDPQIERRITQIINCYTDGRDIWMGSSYARG